MNKNKFKKTAYRIELDQKYISYYRFFYLIIPSFLLREILYNKMKCSFKKMVDMVQNLNKLKVLL